MANIRTINYDVPKHKCPVCNHTCTLSSAPGSRSTGKPKGRPPLELARFIHVLRLESERGGSLTQQQMADRFNLKPISVSQYIHRARKQGVDIRRGPFHDYFIEPTKEEPAQDSLTNEAISKIKSMDK